MGDDTLYLCRRGTRYANLHFERPAEILRRLMMSRSLGSSVGRQVVWWKGGSDIRLVCRFIPHPLDPFKEQLR